MIFRRHVLIGVKTNTTPVIPNNTIVYEASAKLPQTTTRDANGIKTNKIYGSNDNTLSITSHTFSNGEGIIVFNGDIVKLDSYAFQNCTGLTSVTLPNSLTTIQNYIFRGCTVLTNISIPDSVTYMGTYVFASCSKLKTVKLSNNITSIGSLVFSSCTVLENITIPEGVTSIGSSAFSNCKGLTEITIPSSVTSLTTNAFTGCSNIINVTIKSNTVASKTYTSSANLHHIFGTQVKTYTFDGGVKTIGAYALDGNTTTDESIEKIIIGSEVTKLTSYTTYKASTLTTVVCLPTTPPTIGNSVFSNNASGRKIYVPDESVDTYKNATGWKTSYASSIYPMSQLPT